MYYKTISSPLGQITLMGTETKLTDLHIEGDRYFSEPSNDSAFSGSCQSLERAANQLSEYFAGKRSSFKNEIELKGTSFQQRVWHAVTTIPYGTKITYTQVANMIGKPTAVRAVASAIAHNPICIIIPCHRVINSNGNMGGFVAGTQKKELLLMLETREIT